MTSVSWLKCDAGLVAFEPVPWTVAPTWSLDFWGGVPLAGVAGALLFALLASCAVFLMRNWDCFGAAVVARWIVVPLDWTVANCRR